MSMKAIASRKPIEGTGCVDHLNLLKWRTGVNLIQWELL